MGKLILTLWLAVTMTFVALRVLPGDAVEAKLRAVGTSESDIQRQREAFGLDQSLPKQYLAYLVNLAQGDLGQSLITRESVVAMLRVRLLPTLSLALASLSLAISLGLILGSLSTITSFYESPAPRFMLMVQNISHGIITLALATPAYWTATLIIYGLSSQFPSGGNAGVRSLVLPTLVLGFHVSGGIARVLATSLKNTIQADFVRTARAKGLPPDMVFEQVFRVGVLPVITMIALQAGFLLSGTVIIEVIFTRRGLGSLLYQSVIEQDYPVVQGIVLLSALVYTLTRLLADQLRRYADARQVT